MRSLQGNGHAGHQPANASHIIPSASSTTTTRLPRAGLTRQVQSVLPPIIPLPGYQAALRHAALVQPSVLDSPPRLIRVQAPLKRLRELQESPELPAQGQADKKAKAAAGDGSNRLQPAHENETPPQTPPALEPDPLAAFAESKSLTAPATVTIRIDLREALRAAMDVPSFARLSGSARTKALKERYAVLDAYSKSLTHDERAQAFEHGGQRLSQPCTDATERNAATNLVLLRARALVRHMTPRQRHDALRAAKAVPDSPHPDKPGEGLRRRVRFISLYEAMDPAAREDHLAASRRASDLQDMDKPRFEKAVQIRAEQFAAQACLSTPAQRRTELARLRQPGRLVHMEGEALRRAMHLQAAEFWGTMRYLNASELQDERAAAVAMTPDLQEMGAAAWERTLDLRKAELEQSGLESAPASHLPALREAVVPTALFGLRGPALERGLALRKLLVQQLFTLVPPQERDRVLAEARDAATLADFRGATLETAIRLRKLVFEEYFRTAPPTNGAAASTQVELAAALDTAGLASQPEALAARAALLRLALVEAAHQHAGSLLKK